jgi:putative ABC transport system permease protein
MARRTFAERVYRLLLRCYPGEFRDEYEREMLQAFRDRLGHDRSVGAMAVLRLWWQLVMDSILRAPGEHADVLRQDVRYALRSLRRAPAFTLTAAATLALGIGANTAIFSVVHAVALRPLAFDEGNRVIRIWEDNPSLSITSFAVSLPNYVSWRERVRTVDLAAWMIGTVTLRGSGDPVNVRSLSTSADVFSIVNARPVQGRLFTGSDEALNAAPVAMITEGLWRRQFGGDPGIVGTPLVVAGTSHTLVGILPDESVPMDAEFFRPLRVDPGQLDRSNHIAQVIGRLRPGVSLEQARSELQEIARQLEAQFPESNTDWGVSVSTAYDWIVPEETRRALFMLLAAVACVLLIACANVANLMLARAVGRKREMAVRMAIGAGRRRLVRQVLTEGLLLTLLGGAAGVLLAYWSVPLLKGWLPETLPRVDDAAVNAMVLLFSFGVCLVTGLLFGALPALAGSRADVVESLKEGARGSTSSATRWRQLLATAQVALATVLLVGAGLLVQSLQRLQRVDLGFDPQQVTTAMMALPVDRYGGPRAWGFYQRLLERLAAAPGVEAAAITSGAPFGGGNTGMPIEAPGAARLEGKPLQTDWRMVSPGYFTSLRIPLLRGQLFTGHQGADERSMIISATMARRIWGDEDPLGRKLTAGPNGEFTVVGVVGDVRNLDLALEPAPTMYISTARYLWPTMTVIVRTGHAPAQSSTLIRGIVGELDPQLAVFNDRQTADRIASSAAQPRLNASLVALFAVVAALLAALGIYGVLAYLVSQRRQEIGIRMALGASRPAMTRLILGRGLWLAAGGLAAGLLAALAASRWLEATLFGVSARDPWTFAAAALTTGLVTLAASYIPARRAARVDPLVALRAD